MAWKLAVSTVSSAFPGLISIASDSVFIARGSTFANDLKSIRKRCNFCIVIRTVYSVRPCVCMCVCHAYLCPWNYSEWRTIYACRALLWSMHCWPRNGIGNRGETVGTLGLHISRFGCFCIFRYWKILHRNSVFSNLGISLRFVGYERFETILLVQMKIENSGCSKHPFCSDRQKLLVG